MTIIQCDACERNYEQQDATKNIKRYKVFVENNYDEYFLTYDLCDKCKDKIVKIVEEKILTIKVNTNKDKRLRKK